MRLLHATFFTSLLLLALCTPLEPRTVVLSWRPNQKKTNQDKQESNVAVNTAVAANPPVWQGPGSGPSVPYKPSGWMPDKPNNGQQQPVAIPVLGSTHQYPNQGNGQHGRWGQNPSHGYRPSGDRYTGGPSGGRPSFGAGHPQGGNGYGATPGTRYPTNGDRYGGRPGNVNPSHGGGHPQGGSGYGAKPHTGYPQGGSGYGANPHGGYQQGGRGYGANPHGGYHQGGSGYGASPHGGYHQGGSGYGARPHGGYGGTSGNGRPIHGGGYQPHGSSGYGAGVPANQPAPGSSDLSYGAGNPSQPEFGAGNPAGGNPFGMGQPSMAPSSPEPYTPAQSACMDSHVMNVAFCSVFKKCKPKPSHCVPSTTQMKSRSPSVFDEIRSKRVSNEPENARHTSSALSSTQVQSAGPLGQRGHTEKCDASKDPRVRAMIKKGAADLGPMIDSNLRRRLGEFGRAPAEQVKKLEAECRRISVTDRVKFVDAAGGRTIPQKYKEKCDLGGYFESVADKAERTATRKIEAGEFFSTVLGKLFKAEWPSDVEFCASICRSRERGQAVTRCTIGCAETTQYDCWSQCSAKACKAGCRRAFVFSWRKLFPCISHCNDICTYT